VLQQLREGKIDAITKVSNAPTRCFTEISKDEALHLLDISLVGGCLQGYDPEYPGLIALGDQVSSASVASVMAACNWPGDSPRRQKVQRLVDTLSVRQDELKVEPHHPKWNQVDMTTDLEGWQRWTTVSGQEPQS